MRDEYGKSANLRRLTKLIGNFYDVDQNFPDQYMILRKAA